MPRRVRWLPLALLASLSACGALGEASGSDRVGLLRELIRARTERGDTLVGIDACSVERFLSDVRSWRDSLEASERTRITESATACPAEPVRRAGRWTMVRWYRNVGGRYVIRGSGPGGDDEYTFDDGVVASYRVRGDEFTGGAASAAAMGAEPDARSALPVPTSRMASQPARDTARGPLERRGGPLTDSMRSAIPLSAAIETPRTSARRLDSLRRDSIWRDSIGRIAIMRESRRRDSIRRIVESRTARAQESTFRRMSPFGPASTQPRPTAP
ncbi:MAG: hypothetical protein MUF21_05245 [Gemmatimonadaceae bacterium]|nr:hypothetical protein [Gemmatimonadaceae bacterium]